jgi:hypothetical protein
MNSKLKGTFCDALGKLGPVAVIADSRMAQSWAALGVNHVLAVNDYSALDISRYQRRKLAQN